MKTSILLALYMSLAPQSSDSPLPIQSKQSVERINRTIEFPFDGLNYASDGNLYLCGSWKGSALFRSSPEGAIEVVAEGFEGPTDTVMDSKGNLFVSNYNSNYISIVSPEGEVRKFATTPLGPAGMAIDAADNLYVTIYGRPNAQDFTVAKITPEGALSTYAKDPRLAGSVGIAIDDNGVLYVSSGRDARIFRIPSEGQVELFSCLPLAFGKGAGAHLDWAGGFLYAASGIGAVYRINPEGAVHYILQDGVQKSSQGPRLSPLVAGCNGVAASGDGTTLYLGCADPSAGNARTLVRVNLGAVAPGVVLQQAWSALNAQDIELAESLFTKLEGRASEFPGVWFGLGFVHYQKQAFEKAGAYFMLAGGAPGFGANAAYNGACAFALAENVERAFEALRHALASGYNDFEHLQSDRDLNSLHSDPRWSRMISDFD